MNDFTPLTEQIQTRLQDWVRTTGKTFGTFSSEYSINTGLIEKAYMGEFDNIRLSTILRFCEALGIKFEVKMRKR